MDPLVGRENILSALVNQLDTTAQGSGGCVVVEGPIGIGRTRLLKATAMAAAERGLTVVSGRANGIDQQTPTHLLIHSLRHVMSDESEFDDLIRPGNNPFWLTDRLVELVENAARMRPLLIVLDDAQRADDISGVALHGLVRSLGSSPVLWLLARRPVPTHSLAQHAIGWLIDRAAVQLHLGPLDDEAVAELCAGILGAKPDSSVLGWAARCGGNPWLLDTLLTSLVEAGQVLIVDGMASVVADRQPEGILAAVDGLLDELSPAVRRLLVDGSRIGHAFTVEEAADSFGEPPANLSASVDEAVQAGLIRRDGEKLVFVHDVIEEALQQVALRSLDAPPQPPATDDGARRAELISAADAHTERPSLGRPAVARTKPTPPQSLAHGGDDIVAQAISALGDPFDEAPRTLARAVCLLAGAGRGTEACRLVDVAVRPGIDAAVEAQLVLELARGLQRAGCPGMSVEPLQRTLTRQDISESSRARLATLLADTAKHLNGVPGAAPAFGNGNGRLRSVAQPLSIDRDAGPGIWPADEGVSAAESRPAIHPHAGAHGDTRERPLWTWLVRALVAADQFEEAAAVSTAVRQESDNPGEVWPEALWHGHRAELLAAAGRLDEARVEAEAGLRLRDRSLLADSVPARVVLARISLHRGELATTSDHLRMAERLVADDAAADRSGLDWALAQFHAASGRPRMAVQTLISFDGQVAPDPLFFTEVPTAAAMVVRLAREAGLDAEAERAGDFARRTAERNPTVASLAGGAEHADGLLRRDLDALHRAVEHYRLGARPLATGIALEDAARAEQNARNIARAARLLESAVELYTECGAQRDIARVQKKLRRLGVHHVRALGADRPKSGWESLTGAELRVVQAIADGKTNREAASILFLSPHTVDSHLRRVFAKLNINTRVELTRQFIAHEASSPPMQTAVPPQPPRLKSGRHLPHGKAG